MKRLELVLTLEKNDDGIYPYELTVDTKEGQSYPSWYSGKTIQEVMNRFSDSFNDENIKYLYLLESK